MFDDDTNEYLSFFPDAMLITIIIFEVCIHTYIHTHSNQSICIHKLRRRVFLLCNCCCWLDNLFVRSCIRAEKRTPHYVHRYSITRYRSLSVVTSCTAAVYCIMSTTKWSPRSTSLPLLLCITAGSHSLSPLSLLYYPSSITTIYLFTVR